MKKIISRRNFLKVAGASAAALGLAACGGSSSSTASSTASSAAGSSTAAKADGKVYYLNFKPEQDQDWQDLAAEYTKETGVPVTVVTAASGQYETTLMSEMEKSEAPTLFQVNGPVGLANWKDYCYDLSGSQAVRRADQRLLRPEGRRRCHQHRIRHRDLRHHLQQGAAERRRLHPGRYQGLCRSEEGRRRYPGTQGRAGRGRCFHLRWHGRFF